MLGLYCGVQHFFNQMSQRVLFFSLFILVWLLFKGSVYFIGKLADISDDWNRYMLAIQLGLIDPGSSMRSISVLLSAVETSLRTWTAHMFVFFLNLVPSLNDEKRIEVRIPLYIGTQWSCDCHVTVTWCTLSCSQLRKIKCWMRK